MKSTNSDTRPLTLANIFLMVLEQMVQDEKKKSYIRKVRTLMDVPECAKFLSYCVINAMGIQTPIAASTVNKAIDCLIHFYEDNIEENPQISHEQKKVQKELMREFMNGYRKAVKNFMASRYLLK
jgi:hypothetical protein